MAVVYEVNIDVDPSIASEYLTWLKPHIKEMFHQIVGLQDAWLSTRPPNASSPADWVGYTVSYRCPSKEALDDYLENRASAMRQDAVAKFGTEKFLANRRVLSVLDFC